MKTGVFTVSMPEYNIIDTVKVLKELGYDGVEWRVAQVPKETPEDVPFERRYWNNNLSTINIETIESEALEIKNLCHQYGIEIFGLTTYLRPHEVTEIESVLKAAKTMNAPRVRVFTPNYNDECEHEALFESTKKQLRALESLAMTYGVAIVFEIHMDNILASPSAALRLLNGYDPKYLGVIFDPGNMVYEGYEDYKKAFEMLGDYLHHVHIKNGMLVKTGIDNLGAAKWERQWVPLKEGMADLRKVYEVMKLKGYKGNVSVEDFSNEQSTYEKLKDNLSYLRALEAIVLS